MAHQWDHPHDWLKWADDHGEIDDSTLWDLINSYIDADTIENYFQQEMQDTGYYTEEDPQYPLSQWQAEADNDETYKDWLERVRNEDHDDDDEEDDIWDDDEAMWDEGG